MTAAEISAFVDLAERQGYEGEALRRYVRELMNEDKARRRTEQERMRYERERAYELKKREIDARLAQLSNSLPQPNGANDQQDNCRENQCIEGFTKELPTAELKATMSQLGKKCGLGAGSDLAREGYNSCLGQKPVKGVQRVPLRCMKGAKPEPKTVRTQPAGEDDWLGTIDLGEVVWLREEAQESPPSSNEFRPRTRECSPAKAMMLSTRPEVSEEDQETIRSQAQLSRFQLMGEMAINHRAPTYLSEVEINNPSKAEFLLRDEVPLKITRGSHDPVKVSCRQVVVPCNLRLSMLGVAHERLGGHFGVTGPTQMIQHQFWLGLHEIVKAYLASCHPCPVSGNYKQIMLRASLQLIPSISVTELTQFFYWFGFLATFQKDEGSHFMAEESRPLTILIIHFWLHQVQAGIPNCGVYLNFFQTWDKLQTQENELSGMGSSLEHLGSYCADQKFPLTFLKDRNPLTYLTELRNGNKGLMRWGIDLQNYNWKVKRLKNSGDRDVFSRH
ncbi:uncharacterized protein [Palaemon carinicauda]|uniref:uncharacterized protein n=1 Tax=Palaemon carinicauda TaxID=392227 RepID=UPI0035B571C5